MRSYMGSEHVRGALELKSGAVESARKHLWIHVPQLWNSGRYQRYLYVKLVRYLLVSSGCCVLLGLSLEASLVKASPAEISPMEADTPFTECEKKVRSAPLSEEGFRCFLGVSGEDEVLQLLAKDRLTELWDQYPETPWLMMVLGTLAEALDDPEVPIYYQAAAEAFHKQANPRGEMDVRADLAFWWLKSRDTAKAEIQLSHMEAIADRLDESTLLAQAALTRARFINQSGSDLRAALLVLEGTDDLDGVPAALRQDILLLMGDISHGLGRYKSALRRYRELEQRLQTHPSSEHLAIVRYNIASSLLEQRLVRPRPQDRQRVLEAAELALKTALEVGHGASEAASRALIARLITHYPSKAIQAIVHLERCIVVAEEVKDLEYQVKCRWQLSTLLANEAPSEAEAQVAKAVPLLERLGASGLVAYAWRERARARFRAGDVAQGVTDGLRSLDAIEIYRELQLSQEGRADLFSHWAGDYYRLSGDLLVAYEQQGHLEYLQEAFVITERLRARFLLERLHRFPKGTEVAPNRFAEREQVLTTISRFHRDLLQPSLAASDRIPLEEALEAEEAKEALLRDQVGTPASALERSIPQAFASLSEVQQWLGPDEALLSFQIGLWENLFGDFGGGAWLMVVTHADVGLVRIWDRMKLEAAIPPFSRQFLNGKGSVVAPAKELYEHLLKEGLARLPPGISQLVIVPDGRLDQLPFAALRDAQGMPLGQRYRLSVVSSATIWAGLRHSPHSPASRKVWAFVDPTRHGGESMMQTTGEESRIDNGLLSSGAFPFDSQEANQLIGTIGAQTRLLLGKDASEQALKTETPDEYAVLHLDAEAVIDVRRPELSAVMLAPGAPGQDGLLQPREIGDLNLRDRVVVLPGCRTASDRLLRGDGILGFARAFFVAGAVAVVGSLWPLRDSDAVEFFEPFYKHLNRGLSVDAAVQQAYIQAIARGAPDAAWAGLLVLGDGSAVPFPIASSRNQWSMGLVYVCVGSLVVLLLLFTQMYRRA
ncbi:MAG: CHAT domain-containing protein [Myxococcales bacterium]|nr:CHAT domain-containing protein [Myxococcales bacterium]